MLIYSSATFLVGFSMIGFATPGLVAMVLPLIKLPLECMQWTSLKVVLERDRRESELGRWCLVCLAFLFLTLQEPVKHFANTPMLPVGWSYICYSGFLLDDILDRSRWDPTTRKRNLPQIFQPHHSHHLYHSFPHFSNLPIFDTSLLFDCTSSHFLVFSQKSFATIMGRNDSRWLDADDVDSCTELWCPLIYRR